MQEGHTGLITYATHGKKKKKNLEKKIVYYSQHYKLLLLITIINQSHLHPILFHGNGIGRSSRIGSVRHERVNGIREIIYSCDESGESLPIYLGPSLLDLQLPLFQLQNVLVSLVPLLFTSQQSPSQLSRASHHARPQAPQLSPFRIRFSPLTAFLRFGRRNRYIRYIIKQIKIVKLS